MRRNACKRRQELRATNLEFARREGLVVMLGREHDGPVIRARKVCTTIRPGSSPRPRTPCDLLDQLIRSLVGTKVRQVDRSIRRHDANDRYARKVESPWRSSAYRRARRSLDGGTSTVPPRSPPRRRIVSESMRRTRASGINARIAASTRSLPRPTWRRFGLVQTSHSLGMRRSSQHM